MNAHALRLQRDIVRLALGRGLRDDLMGLERYPCPVCLAHEQDPAGIWLPLALTDRGRLFCGACDLDPIDVGRALGPLLVAAAKATPVSLDERRVRRDLGPALDELRRIPAPEYLRALWATAARHPRVRRAADQRGPRDALARRRPRGRPPASRGGTGRD